MALGRTLACLGNHGLTEIHTNGCPWRHNRSQEAKKVPRTAANVKCVESGAESQWRKEFPGQRASALKKASAGSIQKRSVDFRFDRPESMRLRTQSRAPEAEPKHPPGCEIDRRLSSTARQGNRFVSARTQLRMV